MTKYISQHVRSTSKRVYHTDPECVSIKESCREVSDSEIEYHELELCSWCRDGQSPNEPEKQDNSHINALKEAAKDD